MSQLNAKARVTLDKTGFDAGIDAASKKLASLGNSLKSQLAGAFGVAAITRFAQTTIEAVSRIADLSKELSISAESLQELEYAAKLSGSSIESIATAFRALSKARAEAAMDPNGKSGQVFKAMGISNEELQSNSIEQTFRRIAGVVKTMDFGASELAMVSEILGRSGDELIPMFRAGINEAGDEAKKLGVIFSEGIVNEIDAAVDAVDKLIRRLRVPMAGAIKFVSDRLSEMVDLLDFVVGGVGAGVGSVLGGGGFAQGFADHGEDVLDKRIKEEQAAIEKANKAAGPAALPERVKRDFQFQKPPKEGSRPEIQSDQFGRIGAFTGVSAAAAQADLSRRQLTALEALRDSLTRRGVVIRGTD